MSLKRKADLKAILRATIAATGGMEDGENVTTEDLEFAQQALRKLDAHIDRLLGVTEVVSLNFTVDLQNTMEPHHAKDR